MSDGSDPAAREDGGLPWRWGEFGASARPDRFAGHVGPFVSRAVSVHAEPAVVFRWLCQLRVAPYSYDLVDTSAGAAPAP